MERDARSPVATFYCASSLVRGDRIELSESAAHHARVKRLELGDAIRLTDGRGSLAIGDLSSLDKRRAVVSIDSVREVPAPPAIHLRVPIGDRDRMLLLAEKATELGVAELAGGALSAVDECLAARGRRRRSPRRSKRG